MDAYRMIKAGVAIKDTAGAVLARVTDAEVEPHCADIYQIPMTDGDGGGAMISLPEGCY